jgi:hypothetical protein
MKNKKAVDKVKFQIMFQRGDQSGKPGRAVTLATAADPDTAVLITKLLKAHFLRQRLRLA